MQKQKTKHESPGWPHGAEMRPMKFGQNGGPWLWRHQRKCLQDTIQKGPPESANFANDIRARLPSFCSETFLINFLTAASIFRKKTGRSAGESTSKHGRRQHQISTFALVEIFQVPQNCLCKLPKDTRISKGWLQCPRHPQTHPADKPSPELKQCRVPSSSFPPPPAFTGSSNLDRTAPIRA